MEIEIPDAPAHRFETIAGQDLVKRFLLHAHATHRLPHAMLFTGPVGVGKRSLMYALAKHLVSAHLPADGEAGERARAKVARGTHPDVLVVEPRSASGQIVKDQVEEMHERAHYAPLESTARVILISPVEAMNASAANNLLKLLEEPPPALYLLLSCRQFHMVLPTIRSRCALLRCPPVETPTLGEWLMGTTGCLRKRAERAARLSGGKPGLALELLSGEDEERRRRIGAELRVFQKQGFPAVFRVGYNLIEMAGGIDEALAVLLLWFRDLLVARLTARDAAEAGPISPEGLDPRLLINSDLLEELAAAASLYPAYSLARALEKLLAHQDDTGHAFVDGQLLFEVLLTELGVALKSAR